MATLHCVTSSTAAAVTDQEAVKELFEQYQVSPVSYRIEDHEVRIHGSESFIARDESGGHCTAEFLHRLRQYLEEGEELKIQTVGHEKWRWPLVACQFRVTPDAVYYSDLETDEKEITEDRG